MAIIKQHDKRSGITYVYESESYWDREKKQPRARRKLIGRFDEATGETVPTDGRGRKRKQTQTDAVRTSAEAALQEQLVEKDAQIKSLEEENRLLKAEMQSVADSLKELVERLARR